MTSVILPSSIKIIAETAFIDCANVATVTIASGSEKYTSEGNCIISKETAKGGAEYSKVIFGATSAKIPATVAVIGDHAFDGVNIVSVEIPASVTEIGEYAFRGCDSLTGVYAQDLTHWCLIKFGGNDANPLQYAHNLYIGGNLVTDLVIDSEDITVLSDGLFKGCTSIVSITLGNKITTIGVGVFEGCTSVQSIVVPFIGASANDAKCIGYLFGANDALENVNYVPASLIKVEVTVATEIAAHAFRGCSGITEIKLPENFKTIGEGAFSGCENLTVKFAGTKEQWTAVKKGRNWNSGASGLKVECSDGEYTD